ncbi:unnamed protein product [Effrenium voratum]|nr:unnamed protein product [Effrenium voratum]
MLIQKLPSKTGLCVIGGGASGFYAAIACAERAASKGYNICKEDGVLILEKSDKLLHKVSISGGGRCNVMHRPGTTTSATYPRGAALMDHLIARHGALDCARWFEQKGVLLKTERDGRMFPASNKSRTVVDCLLSVASSLGIKVLVNAKATSLVQADAMSMGIFVETNEGKEELECKRIALCTGSAQKRSAKALLQHAADSVGPVAPSLFSLCFAETAVPEFHGLEGVAVPDGVVKLMGSSVEARGPILITHGGISGPAILRLSAWGAFDLRDSDYQGKLQINWTPHLQSPGDAARAVAQVPAGRGGRPPVRRKALGDVSPWPRVLPARLWQRLVQRAGASGLIRIPWRVFEQPEAAEELVTKLWPCMTSHEVEVNGRRLNKAEFVTAGGVNTQAFDWNSMESTTFPGVYFAGEAVDIDGITGGFNFQGCWSSGYVAGVSAADAMCPDV